MSESRPVIDRSLLILLSVVAAITVGNLYLAQPLIAEIARQFGATPSSAGQIVWLAQIGYGTGVLLLVPLGDLLERRLLILLLLGGVIASLVLAATAPSLPILKLASLLIGITTIVPQIVIPYAASLAPDTKRASVIGTVQSGLLMGILLARTFAGGVSEIAGWRGVFYAAAGLCVLLSIAIVARFPRQTPAAQLSYLRVLGSMFHLLRESRMLLRVSIVAALNFAVFTSFWTTLPFLLEAKYGRGPATAGLFGLIGVVGAVGASVAGRLSDRKGLRYTQRISLVVTLISFGAFALGAHGMIWLVIGVIVMDAGVQAAHIACQAEAFTLGADVRSRVNGIYMFLRFGGGAIGSALGVASWTRWGWSGFCVSGTACALLSLLPYLSPSRPQGT